MREENLVAVLWSEKTRPRHSPTNACTRTQTMSAATARPSSRRMDRSIDGDGHLNGICRAQASTVRRRQVAMPMPVLVPIRPRRTGADVAVVVAFSFLDRSERGRPRGFRLRAGETDPASTFFFTSARFFIFFCLVQFVDCSGSDPVVNCSVP